MNDVRFEQTMMLVWALLIVPTLLWWRESIVWLVFMSWYANFVGHRGAYVAAKAEVRAGEK